ncbi:hypothetical protein, partial [Pseudomonas monteilii]|uniref:hypothetical protein n=1 Tax=Pseudomonas monteilii TaxID=76759 RepID=UPI001E3D6C67
SHRRQKAQIEPKKIRHQITGIGLFATKPGLKCLSHQHYDKSRLVVSVHENRNKDDDRNRYTKHP